MFLKYLETDPELWVTIVVIAIVSITLHELGHALTATWEGDPTPRMMGHLTWDPRVHMGWLSLGMVALFGIGFGLTPVNPRYNRHRRWGRVLVSFAGPAVNLALGLVGGVAAGAVIHFANVDASPLAEAAADFWWRFSWLNFALFLFNMIPVMPLDGFTVLSGFVDTRQLGDWMRRLHPWPLVAVFMLAGEIGLFDASSHLRMLVVDATVVVLALIA